MVENKKDIEAAGQMTDAMKKRLTLTEKSIETIARGVRSIAELHDPVGVMRRQVNDCLDMFAGSISGGAKANTVNFAFAWQRDIC